MMVDCHKYTGVREFVTNQYTLPKNYPKKPRGKAMKYVVFDNGGTKFPTGYYNKCGKFKTRASQNEYYTIPTIMDNKINLPGLSFGSMTSSTTFLEDYIKKLFSLKMLFLWARVW